MKHDLPRPLVRPIRSLLAALAFAVVLTGCDVATSRQPVGRTPAKIADLKLTGIWRTSDGRPFFVRVADPALARLDVASVSTNEQGFVLEHTEVLLREENDVILASIRPREPKSEENFIFGRLAITEDALVLTLAPAPAIRRLVLDGSVAGEVTDDPPGGSGEKTKVTVTNGFERLGTILASPTGGQYLDAANPIVLFRQKGSLD